MKLIDKKIILISVWILCFAFAKAQINPNTLLGMPQIDTIANLSTVANPTAGLMAYVEEDGKVYVFNGITSNWESTSGSNWEFNGNAGTTTNDFLGTTDDVRMQIRSSNLPILEFGRRQTLGLTQAFPDYTDNDQPLVYLRGNNTVSALQFVAAGAQFYKPMFFTTINGSFRLKGSTGGTDLFEIGSGGPANDGRLEFIIGDDGAEPIIFKRYDFRNGQFHKELFRVQGSNNTADATTRFGINLNTQEVPVDDDYDDSQAGFNIANSTLQVQGSISLSIIRTTGNLTLTEDHHTIIIDGNHNITLPAANSCIGRMYVIKNPENGNRTVSTYRNSGGNNTTVLNANSVFWLQSDGTEWQQIN